MKQRIGLHGEGEEVPLGGTHSYMPSNPSPGVVGRERLCDASGRRGGGKSRLPELRRLIELVV